MPIWEKRYFRTMLYITVIIAIIYLLIKIYRPLLSVSMPFLVSIILSYLLSPAVEFLESKRLSRTLSVAIVFISLLVCIIASMIFLVPNILENINELALRAPLILEKLKLLSNEYTIRYEISELPDVIKQELSRIFEKTGTFILSIFTSVFNFLRSIAKNIFLIILVPIISFYMLKDSSRLREGLKGLIPRKFREEVILTWYQIDLVLKRFIRGEFIIASIITLLTTLAFTIIGLKFSLLLGIFAGITNFIPYAGPFIGIIPPILISLVESPYLTLKVVISFIIIQQIESNFISPKIVGESIGIHPIAVIFIILLGESLFGVLGMFLAVPIASILIVIIKRILISLTQ